jgi:hypothetical protein
MNGPSDKTMRLAAIAAIVPLGTLGLMQYSHTVLATFLVLFLIGLYFLPAIVAAGRNHHNVMAIAATNLLFGWTFIGWCAALIWSLTKVQDA